MHNHLCLCCDSDCCRTFFLQWCFTCKFREYCMLFHFLCTMELYHIYLVLVFCGFSCVNSSSKTYLNVYNFYLMFVFVVDAGVMKMVISDWKQLVYWGVLKTAGELSEEEVIMFTICGGRFFGHSFVPGSRFQSMLSYGALSCVTVETDALALPSVWHMPR